jgi:hypothetical protein
MLITVVLFVAPFCVAYWLDTINATRRLRKTSPTAPRCAASSPDRKAVEDLIMHYRVERTARWVGWITLILFLLFLTVTAARYFDRYFLGGSAGFG